MRGFKQTHLVDLRAVGRHTSVRILMCIAAVKQRPLRQIDLGSAFLYALVDAIIFVEQPHAFEESDGAICLLQKSLYGINQAPRLWQLYLHTVLTELGFVELTPLAPTAATATTAAPAATTTATAAIAAATAATTAAATAAATTTTTAATTAAASAAATATAPTAAPACCASMASLRVLTFDHEGRPIQFDTWLDDLQLYLLSDSKDSVSLFDLSSGTATAPPATAGTHALYDAVVTRYSSPATAAPSGLLLPYLFPELSAFATVEDLLSHLRTSDARYRATVLSEFLDRNQRPMFITLYFIVTRLLNSLRSVRDHFLSLDPTSLTVDLLEQHILAVETSALAIGAAPGTPCPSFFEGCSPSPLAQSYASAAAADVPGAEDVGAASASAKHRSGNGKDSRGGGGGSGSGGGGSSGGSGGSGGGGSGGSGGGNGGVGGGGGGSGRSGGSGGGGTGGARTGARRGGSGGGQQAAAAAATSERDPFAPAASSGDAIFDLHFDVILSAMYALSASAKGDCYLCVPPDPGIAAAALGAIESILPGTTPAEALHTFTLDSRASRWARSLPVPPLSSRVRRTAALQDAMATTTTPGGQRVSICACTQKGCHLATFTRPPGLSLYTLATEPPQVVASAQVSASGQVASPCSCRLLSHQTLLWHHRLGHPSLPRLRGMHSRLLVFPGLCLPSRPRLPRPAFLASRGGSTPLLTPPHFPRRLLPCILSTWTCGAQPASVNRAASATFCKPLTTTRGTPWSSPYAARSFTLPASPQQNGIAKRHIGLVMEVARTSMMHAAAPHFLWPFAVRYAAHQLNLWPRISLLETSPTLRWTGKVGDASVFRVWGSRAFVRDTSADKLSARAIPYFFLGFPPDAPGWQFYHPTLRRVFPSQDVTFDKSVPFYCLFPYHFGPPPPPPLFLAPGPPLVDPLPPQGSTTSGVSQVDPLRGTVPVEVAGNSGAA
ncbi:unnamed protein product [Closterium sp. NIES-53]